jgi:hypothetical protein
VTKVVCHRSPGIDGGDHLGYIVAHHGNAIEVPEQLVAQLIEIVERDARGAQP